MDNYICINGNKVELTEEQIKQLGFEVKKESPFTKERYNEYYYIDCFGNVGQMCDAEIYTDEDMFKVANYCTDKALMEQRALHETLNRLLWRYSMEHDGDKIAENCHGTIKHSRGIYEAYTAYGHCVGEVMFYDKLTAENAIKEIIDPFMKEHPEFKW